MLTASQLERRIITPLAKQRPLSFHAMNEDDVDDRTHMLIDDIPEGGSRTRTQHSLTRSEMVQGMANRFMYSQFYIALYVSLALLSLISIILSLRETCPTTLFIVFESIINFAMIIEVSIRLVALQRAYWRSVWNIVDTVLVAMCAITLIVLASGCSASERSEAIFDTILLVIRNCIQVFRLFMMVRKNKHSMNARSARVDFSDLGHREASTEYTSRDFDDTFLSDSEDEHQQRL
ncbi:hypothetical protein BCR43DRAFT_495675 [Syncephalastrum racemosum]|uniref:Ion transport domain-containing protein n=1 Tax=Syncephalastrum racemosum TaxID=13706 RepID=A0A1X2H677_SYNRA|nr:hypothetical protein BCR43DRAFT_495675 [Syncephalastrum racemosum]